MMLAANGGITERSRKGFVLDRVPSLGTSYCWRENWVSQAESIYSLLQKFAFLNALGARQVAAEVLVEPLRSLAHERQVSVELTNSAAFDWDRLCNLLRIDSRTLADAFLAQTSIGRSSLCRQLKYCPRCIQGGFHAAIFQVPLMTDCPIHDLPLLGACPHCQRAIPYVFNSANFRCPYHCPHCRQPLTTDLHGIQLGATMVIGAAERILVRRAMEVTVRKASLIAPMSNQYRELSFYLRGVEENHGRCEEEYWRTFTRFSDEVVASIDGRLQWQTHIAGAAHKESISRPRRKGAEAQNDGWMRWDKSLWALVPIYKSIRRRLWRRLLGGHRRCIVAVARQIWWRVLGEATGPVCNDAFAFLLWRMSWEGIGTPQALLSESRHVPFGIVTWLSDAAPICPEDWTQEAQQWLVSRVFVLHCLESYIDCMSYAQMCEMSNSYQWVSQRAHGVRQPKHWSYWGGTSDEHLIRFFQEEGSAPVFARNRPAMPGKQHWQWNVAQVQRVRH